jgi:2-dehydropantoate 2-reductase
MRVCIYGAGAIGCWIGVKLAKAGHDVSVIARGETLEAIQRDGMLLDEGDDTHWVHCRASDQAAELGEQDLVVVAVKAPAMQAVARSIGPLLGPSTLVLPAMNGVPWWFFDGFGGSLAGTRLQAIDLDGAIAGAIPAQQVVGCVVHASCSLEAPAHARHHFGKGLIIGEPAGSPSARVQLLVDLLKTAGFDASMSPQIQKDVWYKLWGNMTVNPVSAITGATTDLILDDELVRGFISRVMLEARSIGERIGIPIAQQPEDRHAVTRRLGAFKTSMLQDVESGRAVELDALVAVVRELGERTGVATPFTDALLGLSRLHARMLGLYPWPEDR